MRSTVFYNFSDSGKSKFGILNMKWTSGVSKLHPTDGNVADLKLAAYDEKPRKT